MKERVLSLCLLLVSLVSCKNEIGYENYELLQPFSSHEEKVRVAVTDEQKREQYLCSLMDMHCYTVEDEKIEKDLLEVLQAIKEKEEDEYTIPILQKMNSDVFDKHNVGVFSTDGEEVQENIKLSLYKLESAGKTGFAITCNDLRVGEILALVEDGEFDEENNPFVRLILTNINEYVHSTLREWEELKKKNSVEYARNAKWRDIIESGEYKYSNWKINNKDFKRFLLKTKWNQDGVYANVVRALKHPEAPAGCVTVAIAQLMAYHRFPEYFYKNPFILNMFKNLLGKCFPIIKQWDGRYNWAFLTRKEKVEDLDSEMCELQVAVLMYHIATSCKATYAKSGTGISTEDYIKSLLNYNYLTGVCKRTYVGPPKEKPAKPVPIFEKSSDNHLCEPQLEVLHSDPSTWLFSDISPNYYKPDGSGHKIRFSKYSFNAIKDSIDCLAPVLIEGRGLKVKSESVTSSNGKDVVDFGHAWVIDGYCNLTCDATNTKTLEKLSITADYVHCHPGWGGYLNGYYISNIFTFGFDDPTARDNDICPKGKPDRHVKYEIGILTHLIPKNKLGESEDVFPGYHYNWRPL